jgi:hypothetical protein
VAIEGTNPTNVFCTYLCLNSYTFLQAVSDKWNVGFPSFCAYVSRWTCSFFYMSLCECQLLNQSVANWVTSGGVAYQDCCVTYTCSFGMCLVLDSACTYSFLCRCFIIEGWWGACENYGDAYAISSGCNPTSYLLQCYCAVPDTCTCSYERLYSIKDYSESQTILDPNGVLNYLAIGYV